MSKHWKYLKYVLRHKWYVLIECWRMGLYRQGIVHDLSKFNPKSWIVYANHFYGDRPPAMAETGYHRRDDTGDSDFDYASQNHAYTNPHHWEFWGIVNGDGVWSYQPMTDKYRREMIADWRGAGKAQGKPDTRAWYKANQDKIKLHDETRQWVEIELGYQGN